jgi:5-carboxymethyl-2-hydroxymuconate isomerase
MPHLVILYTGNLDAETDMTALCRAWPTPCWRRMTTPPAGVSARRHPCWPTLRRTTPCPTAATGCAAGGDYPATFVYLNLRMAHGRTPATQKRAGDALLATQGAFPALVRCAA